jgi:hypothetical protein
MGSNHHFQEILHGHHRIAVGATTIVKLPEKYPPNCQLLIFVSQVEYKTGASYNSNAGAFMMVSLDDDANAEGKGWQGGLFSGGNVTLVVQSSIGTEDNDEIKMGCNAEGLSGNDTLTYSYVIYLVHNPVRNPTINHATGVACGHSHSW